MENTAHTSRRKAELSSKIAAIQKSIESTLQSQQEHYEKLTYLSEESARPQGDILREAQQINTSYKKALTTYNDLRDAAIHMLKLYASREGTTLRQEMEARGIEDED